MLSFHIAPILVINVKYPDCVCTNGRWMEGFAGVFFWEPVVIFVLRMRLDVRAHTHTKGHWWDSGLLMMLEEQWLNSFVCVTVYFLCVSKRRNRRLVLLIQAVNRSDLKGSIGMAECLYVGEGGADQKTMCLLQYNNWIYSFWTVGLS